MTLEGAIAASVAYLASPSAVDSLRRDPYWPKFHSPWWHMTLLWELGLAERIPVAIAEELARAVDVHYLRFFPGADGPLPPGKDGHRDVACHCAIGTMIQVLSACGVDVDGRLPWLRAWLLRYQLSDGGLNCDERAYSPEGSRKSSIVSTLPALEAVLRCTPRPFTPAEASFLDRGAAYLIGHALVRSSRGELINPDWLKLCFPRFFDYDVLRGLTFLAEWALRRGRRVPAAAVADARELLEGEPLVLGRRACSERSLLPEAGAWVLGRPTTFPLLEAVRTPGQASPFLRRPAADFVG